MGRAVACPLIPGETTMTFSPTADTATETTATSLGGAAEARAHLQNAQAGESVANQWTVERIEALMAAPFADLLYKAQSIHRENFDPNRVQLSTLLNIKSGGCPEDCAYCPQSIRYETGMVNDQLMPLDEVLAAATEAKANGATRFCMGAAWRSPKDRDLARVEEMVAGVNALGMESCVTLGMLSQLQAERLKGAGLDYYNHNIDTSPEFYDKIVTTRSFQDRLDTLSHVRDAGINVCSGGILGMGETPRHRAEFLATLAQLPTPPESVPINTLVRVAGTPLEAAASIDPLDLVRVVATARIVMPKAYVRLSAGRTDLPEAAQALCFLAGANSIFYGDWLLTTPNPEFDADQALFAKLGIDPQ